MTEKRVEEDMIEEMNEKNEAIRECEDSDKREKLQEEFNELAEAVKREQKLRKAEAQREHEEEVNDDGLTEAFSKYLRGEELSGQEREALAIRDESLKDKAGEDAIRCPGNALLFAEDAEEANSEAKRATQITSDVGSLQPNKPLTAPYMMDLPPSPLVDRATKLQAVNGVALPIISQTFDDPFAGVQVDSSNEGEDKNEEFFSSEQDTITTTEYNAYCVVSDQALRRIPNLDNTIQKLFMGALEYKLDERIMDSLDGLNTDGTQVNRDTADQVAWADLINMETEIPWYWRQNLEYMVSESALGYLKKQLATTGTPLFSDSTGEDAYGSLNGYNWFLDEASALGTAGDVRLAPWDVVHVGVGKDIAFRRTNEGLALTKGNSTAFAVYSHMGIGIPIEELVVELIDPTV